MGFGIQGISGSGISNRLDQIKTDLQNLPSSALSTDVSDLASQLIESIQDGIASGGFTESGIDTIRRLFDMLQFKVNQLGFGSEVDENLKPQSNLSRDNTAAAAATPLPPIPPQFQIFQVKPSEEIAIAVNLESGATATITLAPDLVRAAAAGDTEAITALNAKLQTALAIDAIASQDTQVTTVAIAVSADLVAALAASDQVATQQVAQIIDAQMANNDPRRDGNRGTFVSTMIPLTSTTTITTAATASAAGTGSVISTNRIRIISKIEELLAPYNDPKASSASDDAGLNEDEQRALALISSSLVDGINSMEELQMIAAWLSQAPGLTLTVPALLDTIQWAIQDFVATEALNATPDQLKAIVNQINTEMGAAVSGFNAISDDEVADIIAQTKESSGVSVSSDTESDSTAASTETDVNPSFGTTPPPPMGFVPPPPRLTKEATATAVDFNQLIAATAAVSATSDSQGDTDSDRNAALRQAAQFQQKGDKLVDDVTRYLQSVCEVAADIQLNNMTRQLNQLGRSGLGATLE